MQTPYFLISKAKLDNNVNDFKEAFANIWSNSKVSYSVKTNSLPWILKYMKDNGVLAEVVSDEEYLLALKCGFDISEIVFNGPIKGEEIFAQAIKGGAYINIDSENDLALLEKYYTEGANIGIRVNVPSEKFDSKDIGYEDDGFRFGFAVENGEFGKAFDRITKKCGNIPIGLHLHCNSVTRSIEVYKAIAAYSLDIIEKYNLRISYLDIGGGYFGGVEGKPKASDYISAVKEILEKNSKTKDVMIIVEPGSALIGSVVDLHTKVIDVKDTNRSRIVTTDGSRVHIDPLWAKKRYMYSTTGNSKNVKAGKQIICGYTCMDHDRIMELDDEAELSVGDEIIYHRIGAYSMTFGGMFIRYYPDVYVLDNDNIIQVRRRIDTDEYYRIQTNL